MAFEADLIVMAPSVPEVSLVAEVRSCFPDLEAVEASLREYMLDRRCALGLLVSPLRVRIYRDTIKDFTTDSIAFVGEFATAEVLDLPEIAVPSDENALRSAVASWLERLASSWPSALPRSESARVPVLQYVAPEVAEGRVTFGSLG